LAADECHIVWVYEKEMDAVHVNKFAMVVVAGLGLGAMGGCADNPPVERVTVPAAGNRDVERREYEREKPMPDSAHPAGRGNPERQF
jgi:hypothetical protein